MRLPLPAMISAALLASALPAIAAPGDDIGATVRIVNLVTAAYERDHRNLATGDLVRQDDLIEVAPDGIGEIKLRDDTKLALGPGARLLLDEFVYKPDISGGAIVLNLVKGAFRFMTGLAAKPAYVIRTPTASITVRGTIFDVYVEASGMSWLLLLDGALEVCNARDECGLLDEPGKLIRITPEGVVGDPSAWGALDTGALAFATAFPFVVTAPQIDPEPISTTDDIVGGGSGAPPTATTTAAAATIRPTIRRRRLVIDEVPDDVGPGLPPLRCWKGWRRVPAGWSKKGWRVEAEVARRPRHPLRAPRLAAARRRRRPRAQAAVRRRQDHRHHDAAAALELRLPQGQAAHPSRPERLRVQGPGWPAATRRHGQRQEGLHQEGRDLDRQEVHRARKAALPAGLVRQAAQLQEDRP